MNIKELFEKAENGTLNYEQFQEAAKVANANFFDLSEGNYVDKRKYENDIQARDAQISNLNETISTRDTDLATLKTQLETAGTDSKKLKELNTQLAALQTQYDTDTKEFQAKLVKQAYEFAVKDFASTKKFTSNAAKRDFINSMISKNLTMENDKIMGAEDFVKTYSVENADAFVVEAPKVTETPKPQPQFVSPTATPPASGSENAFAFSFTGVRAHEK